MTSSFDGPIAPKTAVRRKDEWAAAAPKRYDCQRYDGDHDGAEDAVGGGGGFGRDCSSYDYGRLHTRRHSMCQSGGCAVPALEK